jgi:benzodiazapine receptor
MAARGALSGQTKGGRVFQNVQDPERGSSGSSAPWPALVGFVGLTLLVGAVDGLLTAPAIRTWYLALARPPGTPPNWLFGPVWTVLYAMIAVAAWLIWQKPWHRRALLLWGWQLLANALWTPIFFSLHLIGVALLEVLVLVLLGGLTTVAFACLSRPAALLMLPYLAWTCYAAYLNAGFWWLNPGWA